VPNQLGGDRTTLTVWTRARRIAPAPSPRRQAAAPAQTVVISQAPSATAATSARASGHATGEIRRGTEPAPESCTRSGSGGVGAQIAGSKRTRPTRRPRNEGAALPQVYTCPANISFRCARCVSA
jgi:hypothetical protein